MNFIYFYSYSCAVCVVVSSAVVPVVSDAPLSNSGSVPLAFETVFDRGGNADIWLIKYNQPQDKTYSELEREYAPYARFKAFQDRKVYGCNTNHVTFYEESPFHPELILKDLIKIFHP